MLLNKNQKIVCLVALAIIVLMGLFQPWVCGTYTTAIDINNNNVPIGPTSFMESAAEYYFIFAPPSQGGYQSYTSVSGGLSPTQGSYVYRLDYGRLFVQWLMVAIVSGALLFLFREPQKNP